MLHCCGSRIIYSESHSDQALYKDQVKNLLAGLVKLFAAFLRNEFAINNEYVTFKRKKIHNLHTDNERFFLIWIQSGQT
jgi:hypothetical protein